ncbi:hypothetical protein OH491_13675 [Termitidicoccus mucosus]|uniref:Uncharacterized protein n=1 Tax=Termitidicoccus mucosus TaxID=1184151 RepID=A0A178IJB2_9BACT|nr:hypothetical protein AW736_13775 [Opitutaceae bacterium TSB47]
MISTALQHASTDLAIPAHDAPPFAVPFADLAEFGALPEKRRVELQVTLSLLARVHALRGEGRSLELAVATVAASARQQVRGAAPGTLTRKYYLYLGAKGDWRALIKGYRGPSALPAEFVEYIRALAEDNHRSMNEAWALLREEIWPSGRPVPGYGTWMEWYMKTYPARALPNVYPRGQYPRGWSRRNLYRKAPTKGARMLALRGLAAAKKHFPSVRRDPSSLRPLELIVIDDFELDCLCVFPGDRNHKPQIGRVAGLLAMDVATRRKLHWGIGQRLEREEQQPDGTVRTVRTGIARVDMQALLHGLFARTGLPPWPVTLLVENASASISPEMELSLSTLFEGRVRVERTGLIDHRTLTNGFTERGGKPWEKGWVESLFNQLWNLLGAMPGYKGSNQRLNAPANLDAAISYTKVLLGQGERALNLPPEKIALLRLPFPSPEAVERAFAWACATSDARTDHRYTGFDRVTEFLPEPGAEPRPFADLALLPPEAQARVEIVERMEAPVERWARLSLDVSFQRIPAEVLALLLLTPKKVTYRNHAITFAHDKDGYTYVDETGEVFRGAGDGAEYLAYFDAAAPERLTLADMTGAYAGTLARLGGKRGLVDIRDKEALAEAAALQATVVNRALAEVRARHEEPNAQLALDRAHNEKIVAAHKAETAGLGKAERLALAGAERAAQAVRERETGKALARASRDTATLLETDDGDRAAAGDNFTAPGVTGRDLL